MVKIQLTLKENIWVSVAVVVVSSHSGKLHCNAMVTSWPDIPKPESNRSLSTLKSQVIKEEDDEEMAIVTVMNL